MVLQKVISHSTEKWWLLRLGSKRVDNQVSLSVAVDSPTQKETPAEVRKTPNFSKDSQDWNPDPKISAPLLAILLHDEDSKK